MNGQNKLTSDKFLELLAPKTRKVELAQLIFDGKTFDELEEMNYGKIVAQEMLALIRAEVIDCEDFEIEGVIETGLEKSEDGSEGSEDNVSTETDAPESEVKDEAPETSVDQEAVIPEVPVVETPETVVPETDAPDQVEGSELPKNEGE